MDTPIFRSINLVTWNCCYKLFKSLQTYQIRLERWKLRICYSTRSFKVSNLFIKGKIFTFVPALIVTLFRKKMQQYSKCNNLIVNNSNSATATTGLLRGPNCTVATTLVSARNEVRVEARQNSRLACSTTLHVLFATRVWHASFD